jgi:hypothetical protein
MNLSKDIADLERQVNLQGVIAVSGFRMFFRNCKKAKLIDHMAAAF